MIEERKVLAALIRAARGSTIQLVQSGPLYDDYVNECVRFKWPRISRREFMLDCEEILPKMGWKPLVTKRGRRIEKGAFFHEKGWQHNGEFPMTLEEKCL